MAASTECVHVARDGRLTVITINRPSAANALDPETSWQLATIFDEFATDPDQWVAILTGAGDRAFCAGTDLKHRAEVGREPLPPTGFAGMTKRFDLDKPVIAAVNGAALGGGFEVVLACDLIVASESARFGLTEVTHGLAALGGGIHRLARTIPLRVATELILTGRVLSAGEALELNIANDVVPHAQLMNRAQQWAAELLALAPLALRASKETLVRGLEETSLAVALDAQDAYPAVRRMRASEDAVEGARAFTENRKPKWLGR